MVTGQQVRRLRQKLMQGKTQEAAAAAAGMSVRSAGKWQRGLLPAERKSPRTWRTRPDPFTGIWNDVIEPLLRRDPESALQATTVLEWLEERYPGRFSPSLCPSKRLVTSRAPPAVPSCWKKTTWWICWSLWKMPAVVPTGGLRQRD